MHVGPHWEEDSYIAFQRSNDGFLMASEFRPRGLTYYVTGVDCCLLCTPQKERPEGIIVQFGGQTPLSLAKPLQDALEKNPIVAASGAHSSL